MAKQQKPQQDKAPSKELSPEQKAKEAKRKERNAKRRARQLKRAVKLAEVAKKDGQLAAQARVTFSEYKRGISVTTPGKDGKPEQQQVFPSAAEDKATWKDFCTWKAGVTAQYWMELGDKPRISEKAIARKKAKLEAAKAKLAKLQAELDSLDQ